MLTTKQAEPKAGTQMTTWTNDQLLQALGCRMAGVDQDYYKIILSSDLWTIMDYCGKIAFLLEFDNETFETHALHDVQTILWGNGIGVINDDFGTCWGWCDDDEEHSDEKWRTGDCDWDASTGRLNWSDPSYVEECEEEFILIAVKD